MVQQTTAASISNPATAPKQHTASTTATATSPDTATDEQSSTNNLANTKEKTPMCLINELARYNKVNCCIRYFDFDFYMPSDALRKISS